MKRTKDYTGLYLSSPRYDSIYIIASDNNSDMVFTVQYDSIHKRLTLQSYLQGDLVDFGYYADPLCYLFMLDGVLKQTLLG